MEDELRRLMAAEGIRLFCSLPCEEDREAEARYLHRISEARYGGMDFLAAHAELKYRPARLLEGCRSIIFAAVPYYTGERLAASRERPVEPAGRVAEYAVGRDYHKTVKAMLKRIVAGLGDLLPGEEFRPFVDSGPLDERHYAAGSLGFIGRNGLLINRRYGSWFFLGEILTSAELPHFASETAPGDPRGSKAVRRPEEEAQGKQGGRGEAAQAEAAKPGALCPPGCRACVDACPTGALGGDGEFFPERCISYLTIEHEGEIGRPFRAAAGDRLFGCDTCQEVCPFNRAAARRAAEEAHSDFTKPIAGKWIPLRELRELTSREEMVSRFGGSPLMRCSPEQLRRNAQIVEENLRRGGSA